MKTYSVAEDIRAAVAQHVPPAVLDSPNVRIVGTGDGFDVPGWYGLTLHLASDGSCVYCFGWLPEDGEHGTSWHSTFTNGVESPRTLHWDPNDGTDFGWWD